MKSVSTELKATMQVLLAATTWGAIGLFTRYLSAAGFGTMQIAMCRSFAAALILGAFFLIFNRRIFAIKLKDIWMFFGTGILSISCFNMFYFYTQTIATLSISAVLLYTSPFFVMIMSAIFFKDAITRKKLLAAGIAFTGCLFVTGFIGSGVENISLVAIFTGIGSAFCYSLYSIFGRFALDKYSPLTVTFYSLFFSAIGLSIALIIRQQPMPSFSVSAYSVAMLFGLVSTVIPYMFYTKGLQHLKPSKASVLAFAEPMVATLLGFIVLGEAITFSSFVGIVLIFSAIVILNLKEK